MSAKASMTTLFGFRNIFVSSTEDTSYHSIDERLFMSIVSRAAIVGSLLLAFTACNKQVTVALPPSPPEGTEVEILVVLAHESVGWAGLRIPTVDCKVPQTLARMAEASASKVNTPDVQERRRVAGAVTLAAACQAIIDRPGRAGYTVTVSAQTLAALAKISLQAAQHNDCTSVHVLSDAATALTEAAFPNDPISLTLLTNAANIANARVRCGL